MQNLKEQSTFLIKSTKNKSFGTAFCIDNDAHGSFLVTCEHVIESCGKEDLEVNGKNAELQVTISTNELIAIGEPTMTTGLEEIDYITSLYPKNHTKIVKDKVTKEEFYNNIKGHNIIHLSLHGKYLSSTPMLSHIKLPPKDSEEGHVTALEMFALPLEKNSFVVLSACETGKVKSTQSNETLGIVRALIYAGADALLLSSWEVNEEATSLWMRTFYEVAQKENLKEASRQAIIKVKNTPKFKHPHYWAGFSMIGK